MSRARDRVRVVLLLAPFVLAGCAAMTREIERDNKDPDHVPIDRTREEEKRRDAQSREPRDCRYYAVLAYDRTQELVAQADIEEKHHAYEASAEALRRAEKIAGDALERLERDRNSGIFRPGLKYQTARDGLLDEIPFLDRLRDMHAAIRRRYQETVGPRAMAALRKRLGVKSGDQDAVLKEEGHPTRKERGPRGEHCWVYDGDHQRVSYCWDGRGVLLRRTVTEDETVTPPSPPPLQADACPALKEAEAREKQAAEQKAKEEQEAREAAARKCAQAKAQEGKTGQTGTTCP